MAASTSRRPSSCSWMSFVTALISPSSLLHSCSSSLAFLSPFSMFVSISLRDFSYFRTHPRSFAFFSSNSVSCSLQASNLDFTSARMASNSEPACRSALSCFRSCVAWFSSFRAARMPLKASSFLSSTCFHSSLTSLLQCLSMNFSTKAPLPGSFRATMASARLGAREALCEEASEELGVRPRERDLACLIRLAALASLGSLNESSPAFAKVCMAPREGPAGQPASRTTRACTRASTPMSASARGTPRSPAPLPPPTPA
mmetsp:Transcript_53739/g.135716  ORF Transcript_53739/g.135716 Transcript_53739/m.135716 type:complete len:259 (+) Transcript_53739:836-1612(+)